MGRFGFEADALRSSETGATFSEVPMTRSKSALPRSSSKHLSKSSVTASPKNVISIGDTRKSASMAYLITIRFGGITWLKIAALGIKNEFHVFK